MFASESIEAINLIRPLHLFTRSIFLFYLSSRSRRRKENVKDFALWISVAFDPKTWKKRWNYAFAFKSCCLRMSVSALNTMKREWKEWGNSDFFFFPQRERERDLIPSPPFSLHQRSDSLHSDGAVELTYPPTRPLACSKSFQPLLLLIDNETAINKIKEGEVNHSQDVTPRIGTKTQTVTHLSKDFIPPGAANDPPPRQPQRNPLLKWSWPVFAANLHFAVGAARQWNKGNGSPLRWVFFSLCEINDFCLCVCERGSERKPVL